MAKKQTKSTSKGEGKQRKKSAKKTVSPPLRHWRKTRRGERALEKIREFEGDNIGPRVLAYLRKVDPFVFEELLLTALEEGGYRIRRNRRYTGDGGVDGRLEAEDGTRVLVQAKRYGSYVKPSDLEEFAARVASTDSEFGIFVHTGRTGPESHRRKSDHVSVISGQRLVDLLLTPREVNLRGRTSSVAAREQSGERTESTERLSFDELRVQLFRTVARMEYALKAAGYHRGDGEARADWDRLGRECDHFLTEPSTPALKAAIDYLVDEPPRKQVIEKEQLEWKEVAAYGQTLGERLLVYVRRVRDNLFHGGKIDGKWFEPERSEPLLKYSLTVLLACLEACPDIEKAYYEE